MSLSRRSKMNIMRQIGRKLGDYRRSHNLRLEHVAKQSGVPWQMIDELERGNSALWNAYGLLLDFYDKSIAVELVDRIADSGRLRPINETVKARYRHSEPVVCNRMEETLPTELL